MDERRRWAEALVSLGGGVLAATFFLPIFRDWGPLADRLIAPGGLVGEFLSRAGENGIGRTLLATAFLSAPYSFGAFVLWETTGAGLRNAAGELRFRVILRCFLGLWLALDILLPIANPGELDPDFRTLCFAFAGLLIILWLVPGRWFPARTHTVFIRRGSLLAAALVAFWFGFILVDDEMVFEPTVSASLAGAVLIAIGSIPGLFARPDSA